MRRLTIVFLFLLFSFVSLPARASWSLVTHGATNGCQGGTVCKCPSQAYVSGNLLLIDVTWDSNAITMTPADGFANTPTVGQAQFNYNTSNAGERWYRILTNTGTVQPQTTGSSAPGSFYRIFCQQWSNGTLPGSILDQNPTPATGNCVNADCASQSVTTTQGGELITSFFVADGNHNTSNGTSQTLVDQLSSADLTQYAIQSVAGAFSVTGTITGGTENWGLAIETFKAPVSNGSSITGSVVMAPNTVIK